MRSSGLLLRVPFCISKSKGILCISWLFLLCSNLHASSNWLIFTEVFETAYLLRFLWYFLIFLLILTVILSWWAGFFHLSWNIDHTNKWYIHNTASVLENETWTSMGFWHTSGSPNLGQTTKPNNNLKKKEWWQNCGLCCPGWQQGKIFKKVKRRISTWILLGN